MSDGGFFSDREGLSLLEKSSLPVVFSCARFRMSDILKKMFSSMISPFTWQKMHEEKILSFELFVESLEFIAVQKVCHQ